MPFEEATPGAQAQFSHHMRTPGMEPQKEHDEELPITKATIRVIEIVPQKGSGFTVIAELPPEIHVSSDDAWRTVLPGSFRGMTRLGKLWHFYYGEMPPFRAGDTIDIELSI